VDCGICVQVCPTGIDIRRGLQYECIGCAACIDGCNQVMDRMGYPRGLIRYSTDNAMRGLYAEASLLRHLLRPRTLAYGVVLLAVSAALVATLATRVPLKMNVIRDRAALVREAADGRIENVYRLQVMNTEETPRTYVVSLSGLPGAELAVAQPLEVPAAGTRTFSAEVRIDPAGLKAGSHAIVFHVEATHDATVRRDEKSTFIAR
jgi:cytochrome c oxidase accessory protein FixG